MSINLQTGASIGTQKVDYESFGGNHGDKEELDHNIDKELFYKVLDTDPSAILFFTKENGWIGANKAFFKLVPIKTIEELRTQYESIRELFSDEDEEVFTEYDKSWLDYIRTHCPNGYGLGIIDAKGKRHAMLATSTMLRQGSSDLYLLRLEDKTSVVALKEEVVQVEALKTKFLANIGHEFRTPMNGILGFVDLIIENISDGYTAGIYPFGSGICSKFDVQY